MSTSLPSGETGRSRGTAHANARRQRASSTFRHASIPMASVPQARAKGTRTSNHKAPRMTAPPTTHGLSGPVFSTRAPRSHMVRRHGTQSASPDRTRDPQPYAKPWTGPRWGWFGSPGVRDRAARIASARDGPAAIRGSRGTASTRVPRSSSSHFGSRRWTSATAHTSRIAVRSTHCRKTSASSGPLKPPGPNGKCRGAGDHHSYPRARIFRGRGPEHATLNRDATCWSPLHGTELARTPGTG